MTEMSQRIKKPRFEVCKPWFFVSVQQKAKWTSKFSPGFAYGLTLPWYCKFSWHSHIILVKLPQVFGLFAGKVRNVTEYFAIEVTGYFSSYLSEMNAASQARNELGTTGGMKSFLRGAQIFLT